MSLWEIMAQIHGYSDAHAPEDAPGTLSPEEAKEIAKSMGII
jgi:hypothetical protein